MQRAFKTLFILLLSRALAADTMYINELRAKFVIVEQNEKVVAISPAIPMDSFYLARDYFAVETLQQFQHKGYGLAEKYYITIPANIRIL